MEISNLGEAKFFLGIEIIRNRQDKKIILSQRQFIEQKMQKFNKITERCLIRAKSRKGFRRRY
jgi:CCR4-NOT transcriptional regulation complex NOT5 subunit